MTHRMWDGMRWGMWFAHLIGLCVLLVIAALVDTGITT